VLELIKAGVFEDVAREGFHPRVVTWREPDGTEIAHMPMSTVEPNYPYPMICLPLNRLGEILLSHARGYPNVTILWSHRVVKTGQDKEVAWVEVQYEGTNVPRLHEGTV
jgi:2-polyprenyl-6-methoxyphenol hydroxylase-like FAD-dependent oxidoreductase